MICFKFEREDSKVTPPPQPLCSVAGKAVRKKASIGIFNPSDLLQLTLSPAVIGVAVTAESQDVHD